MKKLVFESLANVMQWLCAVCIFAFLASAITPYVTGLEQSQTQAFMWGLLLERAFAAFVFVFNRVNQPHLLSVGG